MNYRKKFVKVCLKCGSASLSSPSLNSGAPDIVPGVGEVRGDYRCDDCWHVDTPVEVEDPKKFRRQLVKKGGKKC